ncbi:MAG TPA: PAN domain-containing protein [Pyrinomonadaceae bacterium]|jgi:hypothetical protein|nr:PAN domain-containing protein [Pyrinomonadaceae bacterium]
MANIFNITVDAADIKAGADGKATAIFTVTNVSNTPVRGIAKAKALGSTLQDWLSVKGEPERDFSAHGTEQFTVEFSKPAGPAASGAPGGPPEKFPFRLDVFSAANPDEEFTEGQTVNVEVKQPEALPVKKPFPWWILIVAGAALILIVILLFLLFGRGGGKPSDNGSNNAGGFTVEQDTDRAGSDITNFDLPQPNFELCRTACAAQSNCRAYVFVKPGVQGPSARCWLKSAVPPATKNTCCTAGVKK